MSHNEATADRYYNLQRRWEMAIPMSSLINATMTQSGQETVNLEFIFFYFLYLSIIVGRGLKIVVKLNFGLGLGAYFKQGCWTIEDGQSFP